MKKMEFKINLIAHKNSYWGIGVLAKIISHLFSIFTYTSSDGIFVNSETTSKEANSKSDSRMLPLSLLTK